MSRKDVQPRINKSKICQLILRIMSFNWSLPWTKNGYVRCKSHEFIKAWILLKNLVANVVFWKSSNQIFRYFKFSVCDMFHHFLNNFQCFICFNNTHYNEGANREEEESRRVYAAQIFARKWNFFLKCKNMT